MKTYLLLTMLVFPAAWLRGEEAPAEAPAPAPKLVPRAIPGMPALPAPEPPSSPQSPQSPQQPLLPLMSRTAVTGDKDQEAETRPEIPKSDRARIVYIHRRETLPEELTKDLPERPKKPAAPAKVQVQVRDAAIKIIPKSEVEKLILSKN